MLSVAPLSTASEMAIGDVDAGGRPLVAFGEMLIDFVPMEAGMSLAEATEFLKAPGGAPANVAIAVECLCWEAQRRRVRADASRHPPGERHLQRRGLSLMSPLTSL